MKHFLQIVFLYIKMTTKYKQIKEELRKKKRER